MKRLLVLMLIVLIGAVVMAERFPAIHARVPWLPGIPGVTAAGPSGDKAAGDTAAGDEPSGESRGGGSGARRRLGADGPIPVLTSPVRYADVPITADVLGTVQATNNVTARSQIDGKLIEIAFKEGQDVKKGDVIARIDPATYKALYDGAVAKKAQDEAMLNNAQVDLVRYQKLAETQYGSHQQADTQKAMVAQYTAQLAQDQANIDNSKATLDYATIRSPIDGRTGIRQVDQGNVVHASDTIGIVTIAQVKPIAAIFNLPQQWLRPVNAATARGTLRLEVRDGDTGEVLDTGTLQVVDNTVDQTTGTVKMKGSFPNGNGQLWPGQFVNLRLYVDTLSHVVVVPTPAVQRGPDGAFVYVVADDKAVMTKVTAGRQTEADTVLTAGLAPPAAVITTGFTRLTDGAKVSVSGVGGPATPPDPGSGPPAKADASADAKPTADAPAKPGATPDRAADAKAESQGGGPEAVHRRRKRDAAQAGAIN